MFFKEKEVMKKGLWKIIFAILFLLPVCAKAEITDVNIIPSIPTQIDPITILVSGVEGYGAVQITDTDFIVNGNMLSLDIYLNVGHYTVVTPWSHSEGIGLLPTEVYDLNVRTLRQSVVTSTYSTSFEVVPEPATFVFLAAGLPAFRVFTRKKK
jgi:hypothetical protein